jgi:Domain of unknown function (DUF4476)
MKSIKSILTALFAILILATSFAQKTSFGDNYRDDNNRNGSRRFVRRNMEPWSMQAFNRDYVGLSNSSYAFIDKELRSYTKSHNLTSEQIRRLALLLPTDHEKYDYLTYSLAHVYDIDTYSSTSTVLINRNAKEGFYQFLVREGVPAGDYNADSYYASTGGYNPNMMPPPQYDRYGNPYNNNNNYRNNYNNDPHYNDDAFNHPYSKEYKRNDNEDSRDNRDRNSNNTYDNNRNGYNNQANNAGSRGLMTYRDFEILKDKIKQNTSERNKLDAAKSLTQGNQLTSNQIAEITRLFNADNNRLDYAKFAYNYAYDRENYAAVVDAMNFTNSRKDLQKFMTGR